MAALLISGCGQKPAGPDLEVKGPQNPEFDTDVALQIIGAAPEFGAGESRITVIERNMQPGVDQGLWSFRRWNTEDGYHRIEVDLSPEARTWFESAEYNVGGVVRARRPSICPTPLVESSKIRGGGTPCPQVRVEPRSPQR